MQELLWKTLDGLEKNFRSRYWWNVRLPKGPTVLGYSSGMWTKSDWTSERLISIYIMAAEYLVLMEVGRLCKHIGHNLGDTHAIL